MTTDTPDRILRINTVLEPLDALPEDPAGHVSKTDRDQHAVHQVAGLRGRRVDEEPNVLFGRGLSRELIDHPGRGGDASACGEIVQMNRQFNGISVLSLACRPPDEHPRRGRGFAVVTSFFCSNAMPT